MRTVKECDIGRWDAGALAWDAGAFWDAHEQWEAVWHGLPDGPLRDLVRAAIQVAAARHRAERLPAAVDERRAPVAGIGRIASRARQNARSAPLVSLGAWISTELDRVELCVKSGEHRAASAAPLLSEAERLALESALRLPARSSDEERVPK